MKRIRFVLFVILMFSAGLASAADDWALKSPSPHPTIRRYHRMAYGGSDQVVLFGGGVGASLLDETWVYDLSESTWTQQSPVTRPSARAAHGMAHIGQDQVVLFGGNTDQGYDDQTWVYNLGEGTWTQMSPAAQPSGRVDHDMAFIGGDQVLLYGGQDSSGYTDETWVYDLSGNTWTQLNPASAPTARGEPGLAYLGGDQVLLFGGKVTSGAENDETWLYDLSENTWTQKSPSSKPSARHSHGMVFIGGDRAMLFSGYDGALDEETWIYDLGDNQWTQDANATRPTGRFGFGLAETSLQGASRPVLFGGDDGTYSDQTWTFGGGDIPVGYEPWVTVNFPDGGEQLADSTVITWTAADPDPGDSTLLLVDLDFSDDDGQSWEVIDSNQANDGSYSWNLTALADGEEYLVRLTVTDTFNLSAADRSDAVFTVDNPEDDWVRHDPAQKPSARAWHDLASLGSGRVLLFGGDDGAADDETWLYAIADTAWTLLDTAAGPSARELHAMASLGDGRVLLFGGDDGISNDETWLFDLSDTSWSLLEPSSAPAARHSHAMASIGQGLILLFGGRDGAFDNQTWLFDLADTTWTEQNPAMRPSARKLHDVAFIGSDRVLLFGGNDGSPDDETWLYDLSEDAWTLLQPAAGPSARTGHRMAAMGGGRVLLFGGNDGSGLDDQTWVFDLADTSWTQDGNSEQPSAREGLGLCRSSLDESTPVMLFGGDDGASDDETWTFGGGDHIVPDPPRVTVIAPDGGEVLADSTVIVWTATDPDPGDSTLLLIDLAVSDDAGSTWAAIDSNLVNDGAYAWDLDGFSDGDDYLIRVTAADTSGRTDADLSDALFSIDNLAQAPQVAVDIPNGGEILSDSAAIVWTATDPDPGQTELLLIDIDYSDDGGTGWAVVDSNLANDGAHTWDLSGLSEGQQYLVRIMATDTTGLFAADSSDAVFTIITHEDDWAEVFPDPHPPERAYISLAYVGEDRVAVFGGWDVTKLLDDTWVYDSGETTWAEQNPASKPSARAGHAMAHIGGNLAVLFGGGDAGGRDDETWIFDAGTGEWSQQSPSGKPSARTDLAMAFIGGDRVLLFGGDDGANDDQTWIYDFSDDAWTQMFPAEKPSARCQHAMAPIGEDRVVLFGGDDGANDDQTWVYDLSENTWTQMVPDSRPSPRNTFAMAFIGGDQVVLFGGHDGSSADDETWIYDLSENTWTLDLNTVQPAARYGFGMCRAGAGGSNFPILFGGYGNYAREDTWIFGGGDYPSSHAPQVTLLSPDGGETLSDSTDIVWTASDTDPGDSTLLLIDLEVSADAGSTWAVIDSGQSNDGVYGWNISALADGERYLVRVTAADTSGQTGQDLSDDVFTIDNPEDDWVEHFPAEKPSPRKDHAMALLGTGQLLLFGGQADSLDDETWIFNLSDTTWGLLTPTAAPSSRAGHAMAHLGAGRSLLFGGNDGARDDETWLFDLADSSWMQLDPDTAPSARTDHALAYLDAQRALLFGGDDGGPDGETWLFDLADTSWAQLPAASAPSARSGHEMVHFGTGRALLFGGTDDQTWLFDLSDTSWSQLSPVEAPSARHSHDMAFMGGEQALLFGGDDGVREDDTWVFDLSDTSWTRDFNAVQPSAREDHGLCESSLDGATHPVLFGGDDGVPDDQTWTFGGGDHFVPDPPQVTVNHPNGGEVLADSASIAWTAIDPDPGETGLLLIDLQVSADAGSTWAAVDSELVNDGIYDWNLAGLADGDRYLVRATAVDTGGLTGSDRCDAVFSVNNVPEPPQVTVNHPNGGEVLADTVTIVWAATDPDPGETALLIVYLEVSDDGGTGWAVIDSGLTNDGTYLWNISGVEESDQYLVRVTVTDTTGLSDADSSDAVFTIITSEDDWTERFPDPHPPARDYFPMVYIAEGKALLFGGWGPGNLDDTWVYDAVAGTWTEQNPETSPAGRLSHSMAYIGQDRALLFGGWNGASESDETWLYDLSDTTWRQLSPASKPSARKDMAMAYLGGDQVLLLGGDIGSEIDDDETWIFDLSDTNWTQIFPDPTPSERHGHFMTALDSGRVLLFAGERHGKFVLNDETWIFDLADTSWTQLFPDDPPSGRSSNTIARLSEERVMVFGGSTGEVYYDDETWIFDLADTTWTRDANTVQPGGRFGHGMSETSLDGSTRVVLFGGYSGSNNDDTWTFGGGDYLVGPPQVTVLSPDGGEVLADTTTITWTASDPNPGETALLSIDLEASADAGTTWAVIDTARANDGAYLWNLFDRPDGQLYLIRITATDPHGHAAADTSDSLFTVDNPDPPAAVEDLTATLVEGDVYLAWTAVTEDTAGLPLTVNHYTVYRHDDPGFSPQESDSIAGTADVFFIDTSAAVGDTVVDHYYLVKAVGTDGRRSAESGRVGEFDRAMVNEEK